MTAFSDFVKEKRQALGLSQRDLAKLADIPVGTLSTVETGHAVNPSVKTIYKLSKPLGVSFTRLAMFSLIEEED